MALLHNLFFSSNSTFSLHAYSDSYWTGCVDDRRSTSGFCVFLGNNLISLSAQKQATVSHSSTETEYRSLTNTCTKLLWLWYLLHELRISIAHPPTLWCDNNIGAMFLASNPMFHARTKHIELDNNFVREKIASKALYVGFICCQDQLTDLLTKPLPSPRLSVHSTSVQTECHFSPLSLRGLLEYAMEDSISLEINTKEFESR